MTMSSDKSSSSKSSSDKSSSNKSPNFSLLIVPQIILCSHAHELGLLEKQLEISFVSLKDLIGEIPNLLIGRYAEIDTDWPALITTAHKSSIHFIHNYKNTHSYAIDKHNV